MMNVQMSDVAYFVEVAMTKNISRAAERLGITQPALSTAIRRIETQLGTQLLIRSKNGVRLTDSGRLFSHKSKELLLRWHALEKDLSDALELPTGRFVIGCHPSVAQYTVVHSLEQLLVHDIEISLVHDISRRITEQVISCEIDYGLVVNPTRHPDLVIKKICEDSFGFWRHESLPPLEMDDNEPRSAVVILDPSLAQSEFLLKAMRQTIDKPLRAIHSGSLEVIASLTAKGYGYGLLPARVACSHPLLPANSRNNSKLTYTDEICLIYRADLPKSPARKLVQTALSQIAEENTE